MSLSIFQVILNRQNNTLSLLLIIVLTSSTLLLNHSCFDLENRANLRQPWLFTSSSSDSNANARLRQQISRLSDRDGKFAKGKSVVLRSPKMLFLQQLPEKMRQSYIDTSVNKENLRFERKQRQDNVKTNRQLAYLVSPFSEQVLEISQQLGEKGSTFDPNSILEDRYRLLLHEQQDLLKPISRNIGSSIDDECRTIRATIKLEKDDVDKVTGGVVRTCKGLVQVNRCEGSCTSIVQPSIKSPSGFIKECNCCNEGSFQRVQVRLFECFATALDNQRITGDNEQLRSYMDIEVEEPIDCQCRRCAGLL